MGNDIMQKLQNIAKSLVLCLSLVPIFTPLRADLVPRGFVEAFRYDQNGSHYVVFHRPRKILWWDVEVLRTYKDGRFQEQEIKICR